MVVRTNGNFKSASLPYKNLNAYNQSAAHYTSDKASFNKTFNWNFYSDYHWIWDTMQSVYKFSLVFSDGLVTFAIADELVTNQLPVSTPVKNLSVADDRGTGLKVME